MVPPDAVRRQIRMCGDAGIEHCDHHALARRQIPGRAHIDRRRTGSERPLLGQARIVRDQQGAQQHIDLHARDRRIGGQAQHQRLRLDAIQAAIGGDDVGTGRQAPQRCQAEGTAAPGRQHARGLRQRCRARGQRRRGAIAIGDDETLWIRRRRQRLQSDLAGSGGAGGCQQQKARGAAAPKHAVLEHETPPGLYTWRSRPSTAQVRTWRCRPRPPRTRQPRNGPAPRIAARRGSGGGRKRRNVQICDRRRARLRNASRRPDQGGRTRTRHKQKAPRRSAGRPRVAAAASWPTAAIRHREVRGGHGAAAATECLSSRPSG